MIIAQVSVSEALKPVHISMASKSPAFVGSHGLPAVEECGCPPKPWRRRTGASAGYAIPQVPRAPACGAPLDQAVAIWPPPGMLEKLLGLSPRMLVMSLVPQTEYTTAPSPIKFTQKYIIIPIALKI